MAASRGLRPLPLVCAALVSILFLALSPVAVDGQLIDCWKFDGTLSANNTRCPGSNTCCGPKSTCLSNRLCTDQNDPNSRRPVRGPCAVEGGWDDSCPQICRYDEGKNYPRIDICDDGSLCCDDDPECCERGNGIFLDESGLIIESRGTAATTRYPPTNGVSRYTAAPTGLSESTSSTAAAVTTSTSSTPTSSPSPSPSSSSSESTTISDTISDTTSGSKSPSATTGPSDENSDDDSGRSSDNDSSQSSDKGSGQSSNNGSNQASDSDSAGSHSSAPSTSSNDSNALKIGLGVGIPVAVLVLVGLAFCFFRRRSQAMNGAAAAAAAAGPYHDMSAPSSTTDAPPGAYGVYPAGTVSNMSPGSEYYGDSPKPPTAMMYHPPAMHHPPAMYRQPGVVEIGGQMSVEMGVPTPKPQYVQVQPDANWPGQRHELH